jgi:hypothetical protein
MRRLFPGVGSCSRNLHDRAVDRRMPQSRTRAHGAKRGHHEASPVVWIGHAGGTWFIMKCLQQRIRTGRNGTQKFLSNSVFLEEQRREVNQAVVPSGPIMCSRRLDRGD